MNFSTESLNDSQRNALKEFRKKLKDVLNEDHTDAILLKWLKARNFDAKAAEKIFRENYNNRILFGVNTIVDTYEKPVVAQKYEATASMLSFAKDGSLIRYTAAGKLDFYGYIMSMSCVELCLYLSHMMEIDIKQLKEENLKTRRKVNEITYIVDMEGFHLQQIFHKCVIEMAMDFTQLFQDCYPEIWSYILLVNVPYIFDQTFNLFKPILRSNALERIRVARKNYSKELLLKYIDEDVLPVFLGGTRVDSYGDPQCKEFLKFGGKVPESLYSISNVSLLQASDPEVKVFNIRPRSWANISLATREGGQYVVTDFRTDNGSVTVSVFYREFTDEDKDDSVLPDETEYFDDKDENCKFKQISVSIRAQTHCSQMKSKTFLQRPGIYVYKVSNCNSWISSRKAYIKQHLITTND